MPEEAAPADADSPVAGELFVPIVDLTPSMRSDDALKKIHRELLRRIRENDEGVCRGLPGEYLHDFRVAVRRTRTGLRQLRGVYPEEAARRFAAELGWLSTLTSPARDLEVYLASIDDFRAVLDESMIESLAPFVDFLKENQDRERNLCNQGLRSDRYKMLLSEWANFLNMPTSEKKQPKRASRPVGGVAAKRIRRGYRRVVKRGAALELASPAADFHRLRLDFKKLRYLLEFFGGLFDATRSAAAIDALRRTQDSLGKINDLRVQAEWLQRYPAPEADATQSLGSYFEDQQQAERESFLHSFAVFLDDRSEGAIGNFMQSLAEAR